MAGSSKKLCVIVSPVFLNGTEFLRAFGRRGAHCVAVAQTGNVEGFRSRFAHEKVVLPCGTNAAFTNWLLSRTDLYGALVIATGDEVLAELDAHREELSSRYRLVLPPHSVCRIALDKASQARAAADAGVPAPRTLEHPESLSPAELSCAGGLGFPVVVKPRYGIDFQRVFSRKLLVVDSPVKLPGVLDECRTRNFPVVLQELIPSEGANGAYSAYVSRGGKILGDYASRRIGLAPPHYGVGFFEISEDIPEIVGSARRLLEAIGFSGGPVNIDCKLDPRDGRWKILDLNARSWRQVSLAPLVGLDIFDMLLADYDGRPFPPARKIRYGRSWLSIKDALLVARGYPHDPPRLREYARLLTSRFKLGLFDITDLRPFVADMTPLVLRRFRRGATSAPEEASTQI